MRLVLKIAVLVALLGSLLWLWSENRRLVLGRKVAQEAAERRESMLQGSVRHLEAELKKAIDQRDHVFATIDERRAELEEIRGERQRQLRRGTKAMPEGVRVALLHMNDQLRHDGYPMLRALRAERIEDKTLFGVELMEYREDLFATVVYTAERLWIELARDTGALTLRCFDGRVFADGIDREMPAEGEEIRLRAVDGELWEERLPFLVRATGEYPLPEKVVARLTSIDRATAEIWAERLDALLSEAKTQLRYRVARVRDIDDGRFGGVLVHGYDEKPTLAASIKAKRLEVRVDDAANTVELVFYEGALLRHGGEVEIGDSGYRMLLPGVTPKVARDRVLGMVVETP